MEQVTRYAEAYALGRALPGHIDLHIAFAPHPKLLGLGAARNLAERRYSGEDIQVQIDSHVRFEGDWDVTVCDAIDRAGSRAVINGVFSDPWSWDRHIPVSQIDRIEAGIVQGQIGMVEPDSGLLDELRPARSIIPGSMFGAAWCDEVPTDPHIAGRGDDPAHSARLWTHGRTLWNGRVPWYQDNPYTGRAADRKASEHPDWHEMEAAGLRRVHSLLSGVALEEGDPAGVDLAIYGLGPCGSLADWIEYSGIDYRAGTVRTPWP